MFSIFEKTCIIIWLRKEVIKMSVFSIAILGLFIFAFSMSGVVKRIKIKTLDALLEVKNYDEVINICGTKFNKRLLSEHICSTYMLRAYWLKENTSEFQDKLIQIVNSSEDQLEKKEFLEMYYHLYLNQNELENAKKILDQILKFDDENFKKVSQFAFEIADEEINDSYKKLEEDLEAYAGFDLGVLVYNLGMCYYKLGNLDKARDYFYSCESCFHLKHFYSKKAKIMYESLMVE